MPRIIHCGREKVKRVKRECWREVVGCWIESRSACRGIRRTHPLWYVLSNSISQPHYSVVCLLSIHSFMKVACLQSHRIAHLRVVKTCRGDRFCPENRQVMQTLPAFRLNTPAEVSLSGKCKGDREKGGLRTSYKEYQSLTPCSTSPCNCLLLTEVAISSLAVKGVMPAWSSHISAIIKLRVLKIHLHPSQHYHQQLCMQMISVSRHRSRRVIFVFSISSSSIV